MDYFKVKALSSSGLKMLKRSPEKFKYHQDNPTQPTPAMEFGTAAHMFILEPEEFFNHYAVCEDDVDRRSAKWKLFVADNPDKIHLKVSEYEQLKAMSEALKRQPLASIALDHKGEIEVEKYWKDDGVDFKCKLDKWIPHLNMIVDYKTAKDASQAGFIKSAYSLGYHIQCAQYQAAYEKEGIKPAFLFIVQEKEAPYLTEVFEPDDRFLAKGIEERNELIKTYKECEENNLWYSYNRGLRRLTLPAWVE